MTAAKQLLCEQCGIRPAVCIGAYEGETRPILSCDRCCGHGCEDGRCEPIEEEVAS